jgi:hypothetical protein
LALAAGSGANIEEAPLCVEVISIQSSVKKLESATPLNNLNFMKKFNIEDLYTNMRVSLRILLTMPISVASRERSFSKLKLIKT